MPARTISSGKHVGCAAESAHRSALLPSTESTAGPSKRPNTQTQKRAVEASERPAAGSPSSKKGYFKGKDVELLSCIKEPARCNGSNTDSLLTLLDLSASDVGLSRPQTKISRIPTKKISPSLQKIEAGASCRDYSTPIEARRNHLAKLVVNATISSLNDQISKGWKPEPTSTLLSTSTGSRSDSASGSSRVSSASSTKRSINSTTNNRQTTSNAKGRVGEANIAALFECACIAVRYLCKVKQHTQSHSDRKELEIELILCSIIRKIVALDMHHLALVELKWLQSQILSKYSKDGAASVFLYQIPSSKITTSLQDLILEAQTLGFVCSLLNVPTLELGRMLEHATTHTDGPLSWQQYTRASLIEGQSLDTVDRHAYSLERSINKFLVKSSGSLEAESILHCRKLSLDVLLFVSDLDFDAFWDRAARVGSSYFRARITMEPESSIDRQESFLTLDNTLRDVVTRAQQSRDRQICGGKGFTSFCEVWMQLAQKAGQALAIQHVANLLADPTKHSDDMQSMSPKQVEGLMTQACASLSQAVVALSEMVSSKSFEESKIHAAQTELETTIRLASFASDESVKKLFRVLDQIRRRSLRLLDDKACEAGQISALILAVCQRYEQYLEADGAIIVEEEAALDDYIYALRSLANSTFCISEWSTHEAAATYLAKCDKIIQCKRGRMAKIDATVRCNKLRLVASSWYYMGGQLYNDNKIPLAIRFLKAGCEGAQSSLDLYQNVHASDEISADRELKRPEGVAKKWEHLAVSYRYTSQPRPAFEAYQAGIMAVGQEVWDQIETRAAGYSIHDLFAQKEPTSPVNLDRLMSDLAGMMKGAFEAATFDLLLFQDKGEWDFVDTLRKSGKSKESIGALLEHCLLSLDDSMHREEAPAAALSLIDALLNLYAAEETPLRHARNLTRRAELAVMQPQVFHNEIEKDAARAAIQASQQLLNVNELHKDHGLGHFLPQYKVAVGLIGLVREQIQASPADPRTMRQLTLDVCTLIEKSIPASPTKTTAPSPTKRTLKSTSTPRQATADAALRTPPRGKNHSQKTIVEEICKDSALALDDPEKLCSMVEMAYQVMYSSGQILLSLKLLKVAVKLSKTICQSATGAHHTLRFSSLLIRQYLFMQDIGRASLLVADVQQAMNREGLSDDTKMRCLLACADFYCHRGEVGKSEELYYSAVGLASAIELAGRVNTLQSTIHRSLTSERQALAAETYVLILRSKGDIGAAIKCAVFGIRCAMKAGLTLARLTLSTDESSTRLEEEAYSIFDTAKKVGEEQKSSSTGSLRLTNWAVGILHWMLIRTLAMAYLQTSDLYKIRGSARDAEAFASEAVDFVSNISGHPFFHSLALTERAVIRIQSGNKENGWTDLSLATNLLKAKADMEGLDNVHVAIARARYAERASSIEEALSALLQAQSLIERLTTSFADSSTLAKSRAPTSKVKNSLQEPAVADILYLTLRAAVLERKGWLFHLLGRKQESKEAIDEALRLEQQGWKRGESIQLCQGKIAMQHADLVLRADQVMGMLPESVLSLPMTGLDTMGQSTGTHAIRLPVQTARQHLATAQDLLQRLSSSECRLAMDSITLRDACARLAVSHMMSSALGRATGSSEEVSMLLEQVCCQTLQREMLDAIDSKLDRKLSSICLPGWQTSSRNEVSQRLKRRASSSNNDSSEGEDFTSEAEHQHWSQLRLRHAGRQSPISDMPADWTVVSIHLHHDRNSLIITRRMGTNSEPLVFSLPIDRQSRREGEENAFSADAVLQDLQRILDESNVATHSAKGLEDMQARKEWWTNRRALDTRLKELLSALESVWLGAFKCIFMPIPAAEEEEFETLSSALDSLFRRTLFAGSTMNSKKIDQAGVLSKSVLQCFSALSLTTCTDEELEDLIHFVMDSYQLVGLPVAVDEVDLDLCVTELRVLLDGFGVKVRSKSEAGAGKNDNDDRHIFLLLDKDTCAIPWESIPVLRDQAVCRIPSLTFLQDRLDLSVAQGGPPGHFSILSNRAKHWYLLNPSKDLTRTQERFLPWLEKQQWKGVHDREPILEEMADALETNDLVLYFGHGGGEQYLRPSKLRALKRCAVTMLWGCSSGILRSMGDYDRTGTPYNYLMAGCPSLLGNLWDATDRELDGVSESVLIKMGIKSSQGTKEDKRLSLPQAVAQSRNACKLPYLTGAACVVYGVPVYYH